MNKFKYLRNERGLTQEEFRKQFNSSYGRTYTPAAISQFENGKRTPETKALIDFAEFYSVSIDYLLGRSNKLNKSKEPALSAAEYKLIEKYRTLDERGKEAVDETLEREYRHANPKPTESAM